MNGTRRGAEKWVEGRGVTYVLNGVGHAGDIVFVAEAPRVHVHGSTRLVRIGVMDQERFQLVG